MPNNQRQVMGKATGGARPRMLSVAVDMSGQTYSPAPPPTSAEHLLGETHRAEPHEALAAGRPSRPGTDHQHHKATGGNNGVPQCQEQLGSLPTPSGSQGRFLEQTGLHLGCLLCARHPTHNIHHLLLTENPAGRCHQTSVGRKTVEFTEMVICPRPHTQRVQSKIQTQACLSQGKESKQRSGAGVRFTGSMHGPACPHVQE